MLEDAFAIIAAVLERVSIGLIVVGIIGVIATSLAAVLF